MKTGQNKQIPKGAKAVVAMSGGVDSSVCAALLVQQGVQVMGITMNHKPSGQERDLEDAARVCQQLGIEHKVIDIVEEYKKFLEIEIKQVYAQGRTPNPCVICNERMKFGLFFNKFLADDASQQQLAGADTYIVSGHYARIVEDSGNYYIHKGVYTKKDQSYFLYRLRQKQLARMAFPLGDMIDKADVRALAQTFALPTRDKPDSQDFCLGQVDLRPADGPMVDIYHENGDYLGKGKRMADYTIGQRRGIGYATGEPLFVLNIDAVQRRVIVGGEAGLYKSRFSLSDEVFVDSQEFPIQGEVRIRSMGKDHPATISRNDGRIEVMFDQPERAVTPGQSAVVYQQDRVLGGGFIDQILA